MLWRGYAQAPLPGLPGSPAAPASTNAPGIPNRTPLTRGTFFPTNLPSSILSTNRGLGRSGTNNPFPFGHRASTNAPSRPVITPGQSGVPAPAANQPARPQPGASATQPGTPAAQTSTALPPSPGAAPALPPSPGLAQPPSPGAAETSEEVLANPDEDLVSIWFPNAPIEQVFEYYANLVGRIVLRHPSVPPAATITLKAQGSLTRAEARQALDTILAMNNVTMVPMGEKFITAVPVGEVLKEGTAFDTTSITNLPEAAQFVTQIVRITNALPSEVMQTLTPFQKVPGGVVPIDASGVLVLRDYAANVKRMMEVIEKVDVTVPSDYKLEVIPIRYGKVEDIYNVMSGFIGGGGGGMSPGVGTRTTSRSGGRLGSSRGGSTLGRTGTQNRLGGMAGQPGVTPQAGAGAAQNSFQQRLQQIVGRAAAGADSQLIGDARVIPDERANSLVVYADKRDFETITNIVAKLDVALAQVLIEAIIMEVSVGNNLNLGFSAVQYPMTRGNFTGAGIMDNGQSLRDPSNLLTNATGGGGFSYFGKWSDDFAVSFEAIASDSTINVLSRPRIQTTHAVPADFFVGDTVPYITGTYYGGYGDIGSRSQYQQLEVGIGLYVTPFITPDGLVVLEIEQEISQLGTPTQIDGNDVPTTTTRRTSAIVSVRDRETIMLGGFINANKSRTKSGVPILKDIPVLGALFRSKNDSNKRTELILLMRPTVLQSPQDAARIAEQERSILPGVRAAEKEFRDEERRRLDKYNTQEEAGKTKPSRRN